MKSTYYQGIFLILLFSTGWSKISTAQTPSGDSAIQVNNKDAAVHIAYGSQPAWMVTGALSTVKGTELQKSFNTNLANTLFGRLPGLTVMQGSSEPGANSPALYGRGVNTFGAAGHNLLVIVDGYESTFEQLTTDEIESVSFLKDASATALYGSRAANGVLLITTKRGKEGPLEVTFSTQQGFTNAIGLPKFSNSYDYARLYNEALVNDGKTALYTENDLQAYKTGSDPYFHPDVNWYKQTLRNTAPISNYNLNFNGGSSTVRYFVALNAMNSQGLYIKAGNENEESTNSKFSRYNFRSNVDINITKRLTAYVTLGGTVEDKANPAGNTTGGLFDLMAAIPPNAFPVYNPDGSFGGNARFTNPLGNMLQTGSYTSNGRSLQSAIKLTQQLDMVTPGLSASLAFSSNNFFTSYSNKSKQYERFSISKQGNDTVYTKFGQETSLTGDESQSDQWRNYALQGFLDYNRSFGQHDISTMLMYNQDVYEISGNNLPYKHINAGGRFTYANSRKYIAELSLSYMGSENFPKGNRFGYFPAVSAGWIASEEAFLKESTVFSYLKIRASYGLVGNDKIGGQRFMFDQLYPFGASPHFGTGNTGTAGLAEGTPANTGVTWEKEKKMNFGLEATIAKRLQVTLDIFKQDRYHILAQPNLTVPQYVGVDLPTTNVGKVNNQGFEAMLRYNSNPAKNLQWFVETGAWYAKNKIVYNSESVQLNTYLYQTGRAVNQPFGLEAIGFFKDEQDITASPKQIFTPVQPGDIKYKDQNGDNVIDQNDAYPIGKTALPTLTYTLHTGFQFKGFDLDALFQGVSGNTIYLGANYQAFQNNGPVSPMALGRWTPETAATATYPRLSSQNNLNNYRYSSFWQRNGSFIKLRSLEVGYTLPPNTLSKIHINMLRVFINGTNLFSIDGIDGNIDPETLSVGYPAVRTLSAGTRIRF
ncbi:TonB-dependent receptor [Chitinophaga sp. MM2321]|uniref:SusC/RagA family TonB-linked outer membrane protein n=1 Tax=Chitinophaga sp. MM2321 TaxID=3137178 RepID=UPI0032D58931